MGCVGTLPREGEAGSARMAAIRRTPPSMASVSASAFIWGGGALPVLGYPTPIEDLIAPGATTDVVIFSGSWGSSDLPSFAFSTFSVIRSDCARVVHLDPVDDSDWTLVDPSPSGGGPYDAYYTLTVTQAQVDAASP